MRQYPGSAGRRRRTDIVSLGIVAGFAWTIACLLLTGGSNLAAPTMILLWIAGLAVVACVAALVLRMWEGRRTHR
ncbi:hypothetical protein [Falsiroseomonas oryzae]|uniref:hypothetical protein n=1 Tax=Falsiroseomonas oryzae TaxID=2766473 RepID=UPI0022EA6387|nr:hypothetical protein [Roseomonas sp. MO-31]